MSPSAAFARVLAEALEPFRAELEKLGVTTTIDSRVDRLTGDVECGYTFRATKALAEKLASESV